MNTSLPRFPSSLRRLLGLATILVVGIRAGGSVLDDFNAATSSGWQDANPANLPLPGGVQADGVFTFTLPPPNQPYFVSSTKVSDTFELKEGRTLEFRVDLVHGQGPDSFAVLGFIPKATGANSLAGYGLAKSETDILVTKGIGKYFYNENPTPAVKNENVTLVLNLTAKGGNIHITGRVLDKDDGNKIIWEQSFVDTPAAEIMADGADSPPAPYINVAGNFVLYLYADGGKDPSGYQVVYDNAETFVCDAAVLDDFSGATRDGWEDSDPINIPLPGGQQADGVFTFGMPPIGQAYFVASTKNSKTFELAEGTLHEFSVDLVSGQGPDSFAVLGFIPKATGANSLAGYGISKSETDMLITKGIGKYFFNQDPTPAIKNNNVTLVLTLTAVHGSVEIRGRVLDKDDNNAVIFDKSFVDTPAAEVFDDGTDSPPAPFINQVGNVVLYLYADGGKDPSGYQVVYDNLIVCAPPAAANQPPVISEISPKSGANFLPANTQISFKVADDKAIADSGVAVTLNGVVHTTANGLSLSAAGTTRTATLGGLDADTPYTAELKVTDSDGVSQAETIFVDTFLASDRIIEIEDYNFDGGQYFNDPVRTAEGGGPADNSFTDRAGVEGTDFHETRATPNGGDTQYRTADPVRMAHSLDQRRAGFDPDNGVYDYDVGDLVMDEWMNYTRAFAPGSYELYLREAVVNFPQADSVLEQVTGDPHQSNATVKPLGSFLGKLTGYTFQNVPLTDGTGQNKTILRLSGETTLRLRTVTGDTDSANRYLNYLLFRPVPDPGIQRAAVIALSPGNGASVATIRPRIDVTIQNRDTSVKIDTVKLKVNDLDVAATVTPTPDGATVSYVLSPLPASGADTAAKLTFTDNLGVEIATDWHFVVTYKALDPANARTGTGKTRGFTVRMAQGSPDAVPHENSLNQAEDILAGRYPLVMDTNVVAQVINENKRQNELPRGYFPDDELVPGLFDVDLNPLENGDSDFAVEAVAWLDLAAGTYRFGAYTDDGFKTSSGAELHDFSSNALLGFWNGGPADSPEEGEFEFVVTKAGLYPFRFMWYERQGAGYGEFFSVDAATGTRTLINDPNTAGAVKAYVDIIVVVPTPVLQSSASVAGGYTDDPTAVLDANAHRFTVPVNGDVRYYRIKYQLNDVPTGPPITSIKIVGGNVVLEYQ